MQKIFTYVRASSTLGKVVDAYNVQGVALPTLTLCLNAALAVTLYKGDGSEKYTQAELSAYSWKFYADSGYGSTDPILATESGITASDGVLTVPIDTTGNAVAQWLGTAEKGTLHGELQGFATGSSYAQIVVQFDITIRNRVKR